MKYRPALDGLRGIAVLSVLISHTWLVELPRGAYGVDIFMVLSGFLITSLLVKEFESHQTISFLHFYARRLLRLTPALLLVLALAAILGQMLAPPLRLATREGIRGGLLYIGDLQAAKALDTGILGNLWSLGVEEHFYMIWPPVLLMTMRFGGKRTLAYVCAAMFLALTLLPSAATFREFRVPGLFLGCLIALKPIGVRGRVGSIALVALVLMMVRPYGANHAVVELLSAILVLTANQGWSLLSQPQLVGLGKISYGLYLYHYPIFSALLRSHILPGGLRITLLVGVTSFLVSVLSYRLVEIPSLRLKARLSRASEAATPLARPEEDLSQRRLLPLPSWAKAPEIGAAPRTAT